MPPLIGFSLVDAFSRFSVALGDQQDGGGFEQPPQNLVGLFLEASS